MNDWVEEKWAVYLKHIVDQEEARSPYCEGCNAEEASWRCLDCLGRPRLCRDCCRIGHRLSPFHKVETWNGAHWSPAWLWHVGTVICLGHGRNPCPKYEASLEQLEERLIAVNAQSLDQDNSFCAKPEKRSVGCGNIVCFLHTNGFHYLPVYTCWCSDAHLDDAQFLDDEGEAPVEASIISPLFHLRCAATSENLHRCSLLDHAFYPASWKSVRTALTFSVLQQFNLFKLHAHISTETYLDILCRLTNDIFPSEAPDRQSILRRVWAQWNYLSALKKNGYERAQLGDRSAASALALYCPACPQPGVNLPENWRQDKDQPPSSCAKLRAVSERNVFKKGYDVTGVVAVACARHGCFAPGGIIDLQKGERQLNVDYALVEALRLTKATDTPGGLLAYDVNCQYCLKLRKRIKKGPYLSLDQSFPLDFVIGLFHVHGHKDDGKILESLWSQMNPSGRTTRNMTLGRRADTLDALAWYNNLRKLEGLGKRVAYFCGPGSDPSVCSLAIALPKQLSRATAEVSEAEKHMKHVRNSTTSADWKAWKGELEKAIDHRKGRNPPVVPMQAVKAALIEKETNSERVKQGVAAWVATSIEVQAAQIDFRNLRRRSPDPSPSQSVDLAKKAQNLAKRIMAVFRDAHDLFPKVDFTRLREQWEDDEIEICVCEEECSCDEQWGHCLSPHLSHMDWTTPKIDPGLDLDFPAGPASIMEPIQSNLCPIGPGLNPFKPSPVQPSPVQYD
ncbi:hypothetical protein NMY22_g13683 [Coprinellus aureogranulatus]|nr:hypothetical protein NMY22_g13683 [Coprinellus aureogranulatus]